MSESDVRIRITRLQDGECEELEYNGKVKDIGDRLYVTFADEQEDGGIVNHILKINSREMEWIRLGAVKSKTAFKAGAALPFLFTTPHGRIELSLATYDYSYIKKDTHEISVSYKLLQGAHMLSECKTNILIY